jgi:hypothetical protein
VAVAYASISNEDVEPADRGAVVMPVLHAHRAIAARALRSVPDSPDRGTGTRTHASWRGSAGSGYSRTVILEAIAQLVSTLVSIT